MSYSVIRMQEDFLFQIFGGETLEMGQAQAVNVAPYHYVTPYITLKPDPANSIPTPPVTFKFYTAPVLLDAREGLVTKSIPIPAPAGPPVNTTLTATGYRFMEVVGYTVTIPANVASASLPKTGITYTASIAGGEVQAIKNPGGLLVWTCTCTSTAVFRADIYLVCRGPS